MLTEQMLPWQLASVIEGTRNLPLKFGQNLVTNCWDIPDMDKCRQDKWCLDKCPFDSWNLFQMFPGTYLWGFIKIGSVTAEIFLIWTNVTWTNVAWTNIAWTNVTVTVGICSRCSQEPTFKVSSKSGQLELRYSWYGHHDSWNLFQMFPGTYL